MRRYDSARDASPPILTWGDLAVVAGGVIAGGFVLGSAVAAGIRMLVALAGGWS